MPGTSPQGTGLRRSLSGWQAPSLLGDLGTSYAGAWIGDIITLGTTISAFGCCLACTVGASRLMYALARDAGGSRGAGRASRTGVPAAPVPAAGEPSTGLRAGDATGDQAPRV